VRINMLASGVRANVGRRDGMPSPGAKGSTLVVGGDGRYYSEEVCPLAQR